MSDSRPGAGAVTRLMVAAALIATLSGCGMVAMMGAMHAVVPWHGSADSSQSSDRHGLHGGKDGPASGDLSGNAKGGSSTGDQSAANREPEDEDATSNGRR